MNQELEMQLQKLNPELCPKKMSRHYQLMDTRLIVDELLKMTSKGEEVFELRQIQTKRKGIGKGVHTVKLQTRIPYEIGGEILHPEVVIMNSYDGSSPLKVYVGVFRMICSNGLVIKTKDFGEAKIRHMGTPAETAFDIVKGFAKNIRFAVEAQEKLVNTELSEIQITEFAKQAAKLRWDLAEDADFEEFTSALRPEDEGNSAWLVYNRLQEKLMQGGVKMKGMKRTAKALTNAAKDIEVNEKLFDLAMSFVNTEELAAETILNQVEETLDINQTVSV